MRGAVITRRHAIHTLEGAAENGKIGKPPSKGNFGEGAVRLTRVFQDTSAPIEARHLNKRLERSAVFSQDEVGIPNTHLRRSG